MQGRLPRGSRAVAALIAIVGALLAPQAAGAAIDSVFGGDVGCTTQSDGIRFCGSPSPRSTTKTFDGVPLDVNVAFPPAPSSGADGGYPLIMLFHGYGGGKIGLSNMQRFLDRGYATFSMTDRGFRESCGSAASQAADPAGCASGYVRLDDTRYEVRDAQLFAGKLADAGLIDPQKIGAIGGSYGGGISLALAALRNRMMLPDGSLVPWTSPNGTPMEIAAATPSITWSDLAYALAPNGGTLDYTADNPYTGRFGVLKESLVQGLYLSGLGAPGFYSPPGVDPSADLITWMAQLNAGEPYDSNPAAAAIRDEITAHHSAYYIDDSVTPAPIFWANGFTDDLFPADEALRYYNRTLTEDDDAIVSLAFGEVAGHPRSTSKPNVNGELRQRELDWFDHFVKGTGPEPFTGVEAFTQTCPASEPDGGPFLAKTWARLAPGEIRFDSSAAQTIVAGSGDPTIAAKFDPVSGGGACAKADGADQPGVATYRLDPAPAEGYTLLGSPTVIAEFTLPGDTSQVAARLLDVGPDGQEQLIARNLLRPASGGPSKQVFQLHANGWHFDEGHVAKLELLPADAGGSSLNSYGRPSNDQQNVTVSNLELRLPVRDKPGALNGLVEAPAPKVLPKGAKLAFDYKGRDPRAKLTAGPIKVAGSKLRAKVKCPSEFETCRGGKIVLKSRGVKGKRSFTVAKVKFQLAGGAKRHVNLKPTARARKYLRSHGRLPVTAKVTSAETLGAAKQIMGVRKRGHR